MNVDNIALQHRAALKVASQLALVVKELAAAGAPDPVAVTSTNLRFDRADEAYNANVQVVPMGYCAGVPFDPTSAAFVFTVQKLDGKGSCTLWSTGVPANPLNALPGKLTSVVREFVDRLNAARA